MASKPRSKSKSAQSVSAPAGRQSSKGGSKAGKSSGSSKTRRSKAHTPGEKRVVAAVKKPKSAIGPRPESAGPLPTATAERLNAIDRKLLELLQDDARSTNLALAGAVGLSPAACHDRVRKLVEQGWILGFSARLNADALNAGLLVFASIQIDLREAGVLTQLEKVMSTDPQFLECHRVSGQSDIIVKVRTHDLATYRQLLDKKIYPVRGVIRVDSQAALQTLKETSALPVSVDPA